METRDKVLLLLVLGVGGYYGHKHWPEITAKLGLGDLAPGRIRAIELCRHEFTFDRSRNNGMILDERIRAKAIEPVGDLWSADPRGGDVYLVTCCYTEDGDTVTYKFEVHLGSGAVTPLE